MQWSKQSNVMKEIGTTISLIDTLYAVVALQHCLISFRSNSVSGMAQLFSIARAN